MSDDDHAMRVVNAVRSLAEQTHHALLRMKTPQAAFAETEAAVTVSVDQALYSHHSAQSRAEADKFRAEIMSHGARLDQLRQHHEATLDAKSKEFEHQRRLAIEDFCRLLIQALGPDLFQNVFRDLTKNASDGSSSTRATANHPTPPADEPEPEVVSPAEHHASSPPASSERPARANASTSPSRKRRTDAEPESHGRRKRTAPEAKRVEFVWFDELYEEGEANLWKKQHIIMEHPKGSDKWYIIQCQTCPRDFNGTPLRDAGAHLQGSQHRCQHRDAAHVVEYFGIPVLNCNKELAEKNNAVVRLAFSRQDEEARRPPDDTAASGSRHGRRGGEIVSPTPGQVYLGYWEKAKKSWPVLALPTTNLEDVGVPGTLETLGLLKYLPPCYRLDTTTDKLEWEEGFEDGGAKVSQRRFPVLFFEDGVEFPSDSQPAWLNAKDLDVLDVESTAASDFPHIRSVRAYLKARAQVSSKADSTSEKNVHDDAVNRRNDETHQTPEVDESNPPEPSIVEPWGIRLPTLQTSIGAAGNSNDNLRSNSVDIISISSSPAPESHETYPDGAAVPLPNRLNRTTSAPYAHSETITSTHGSVNNPHQPTQANTIVEPTVQPRHSVPLFSAEPTQVSESPSYADYLAIIAQNGLKQKLELSDSVPPGTVQQVAPRPAHHPEDNPRRVVATYSDFSRELSRGSLASDTTTIPPQAENLRTPFSNPNQPHQYHGPNTPQVESSSNTSALSSGQSQPQPQFNTSPAPYHPELRAGVAQQQSTIWYPDPRHEGQHQQIPSCGGGGQAAAPHANHHVVSEHDRIWSPARGNEATHSQAPHQRFRPILPSETPGNTWRSINGVH